MKKYTLFIICTLLTGLLFTTCEPWIVPEAVFVNFNANGGQGDMKAQRFEKGIISQQLSSNEFTRTGYVFVGWNTRADGKGTSYADMEMAEIKKSVTLYAQWSMICKVHFNANGATGTMAAQTFVAGVAQTIAANTFTRSGYTFTGWNTKADGRGTSYTDKQPITLWQDITLYAQWKKDIVNYTVTFNANGGTGTMAAQTFVAGVSQTIAANAFTRSGYTFTGWNTAANGSGNSYTDGQEIALSQDITLYAQWKKGIYTVTFDANGGTGTMAAQTFEGGVSQALSTNVFTRDGFLFDGWNTKADGSGTSYTDKQSITISQNITLYAQWKKYIVKYTVTFKPNGGSGVMAAQTFEAGVSQAIKANTFTRSGYTFTGWNTKADGSGTSYTDKQILTISQNITLYAQWKKDIVTYTVIFNANGGSGTMAAQTFEAGVSQAIAANTFTRDGYSFAGWNTAADGSGTSYKNVQVITLRQNMTLYAQWFVFTPTYVDLGLSVKWATCNIGAATPEGYGDYFAWGETTPKSNYTWETYKFRTSGDWDGNVKFNKYNTSSNHGTVDNKTTLDLSDDAARTNWGGTWRLPTSAELVELRDNCTWTWTTQNGVNGYKVTSKTNGNSIFLPAAGYRYGTSVGNVGSYGYYWSSSLGENSPHSACYLSFYSGDVDRYYSSRDYGRTVRAVCP